MAAAADRTRRDLIKRALQRIRVLRAGESPTQVQEDDASLEYDTLYAELGIYGVAFWDVDNIPVSVFGPLSMLLAAQLAPTFGKDYGAGDAMFRLYAVAAKPWSGEPVKADYF